MKRTCDLGRGGSGVTELHTQRLLLRQWRDQDRAPWAALNADPEVMRHFPATLTREQSDTVMDRIHGGVEEHGWGLWAVQVTQPQPPAEPLPFIGFVGLQPVNFQAHFTPAVEVGWRLSRQAWGYGYATEAATAALNFAFTTLQLDEVISMTIPANNRSRAVMERLGMARDSDGDFEHPNVPAGPIRHHVLYRLPRAQWTARARARAGTP